LARAIVKLRPPFAAGLFDAADFFADEAAFAFAAGRVDLADLALLPAGRALLLLADDFEPDDRAAPVFAFPRAAGAFFFDCLAIAESFQL
jgi:hypothetical protein